MRLRLAARIPAAEPGASAKTRLTKTKNTASVGWHVTEALRRMWCG